MLRFDSLSCGFETDLCLWSNTASVVWTRTSGSTPSPGRFALNNASSSTVLSHALKPLNFLKTVPAVNETIFNSRIGLTCTSRASCFDVLFCLSLVGLAGSQEVMFWIVTGLVGFVGIFVGVVGSMCWNMRRMCWEFVGLVRVFVGFVVIFVGWGVFVLIAWGCCGTFARMGLSHDQSVHTPIQGNPSFFLCVVRLSWGSWV